MKKPLTPIDEKHSGEDEKKNVTTDSSRSLNISHNDTSSGESSLCDDTPSGSSHSGNSERSPGLRVSSNFDKPGAEGSSASLESSHVRAKENFMFRINGLS